MLAGCEGFHPTGLEGRCPSPPWRWYIIAAIASDAILNAVVTAMQRFVNDNKGVLDDCCDCKGAVKEVLEVLGKAVASGERWVEPTAPLPGRNKGG